MRTMEPGRKVDLIPKSHTGNVETEKDRIAVPRLVGQGAHCLWSKDYLNLVVVLLKNN